MTQFKNHKATESPNLLVGLNNPDDGGVIQVGDQKIIQTVDFFTPILDNPYDWGRVAAANALSDVYAMGGEPISALQLVCWPRSEISFDILSEVIKGGLDTMQKANCTVIGGHSAAGNAAAAGECVIGSVFADMAPPGTALLWPCLLMPMVKGMAAGHQQALAAQAEQQRRIRGR